jgi:hypothetical protein
MLAVVVGFVYVCDRQVSDNTHNISSMIMLDVLHSTAHICHLGLGRVQASIVGRDYGLARLMHYCNAAASVQKQ